MQTAGGDDCERIFSIFLPFPSRKPLVTVRSLDYVAGMRFWKLLGRALRLRCPICGQGQLFKNWFVVRENCPACGVKFEREPGFFLGSIYFNYGLTALISTIAYIVLQFVYNYPERYVLAGTLIFVVIFPLWFHRYARSLWAGFDQWHDPRPGET
jgi:uncharacterized protein (DUF983 family)